MDSRLKELKQAVESAVEGLSSEQMSWHPAAKWCAAEVLEHLYLTYTGTIKGFARVMEAGKPLATRASMKQRVRTLVVVGFQHMPEGRKAPAKTRPRGLPTERRCGARWERRLRRWMRSSRSAKPASGAAASCSITRFWGR